jgi:hypothetical protein
MRGKMRIFLSMALRNVGYTPLFRFLVLFPDLYQIAVLCSLVVVNGISLAGEWLAGIVHLLPGGKKGDGVSRRKPVQEDFELDHQVCAG